MGGLSVIAYTRQLHIEPEAGLVGKGVSNGISLVDHNNSIGVGRRGSRRYEALGQ